MMWPMHSPNGLPGRCFQTADGTRTSLSDTIMWSCSLRRSSYRRGDQAGRAEAVEYGKTVGVPEHQLDWPE